VRSLKYNLLPVDEVDGGTIITLKSDGAMAGLELEVYGKKFLKNLDQLVPTLKTLKTDIDKDAIALKKLTDKTKIF
jgi:hypothetical protein